LTIQTLSTQKDARRAGGVQSVERAFELLEWIADAGQDITLSELAAGAGLPLPTIHRLLRTLVNLGLVRQLPSRRYALGARLIYLGEKANHQVGSIARPELEELVEALGETANMAMLDQDMAVYVAQVPSPHPMRMFTEVGHRVGLDASGVGKAILATLDHDAATELLARVGISARTEHGHHDTASLLDDLENIRRQGYAVDDGEQEVGVRCYAVAVPGAATPMAISVSGPLVRMDNGLRDRAVPLLQSAAGRIAQSLR
jgi:IclR family acetate operon transcriptional repressor